MERLFHRIGVPCLFALSFTLAPLYIAHYYLIFGLTQAGFGQLNHDWLSHTTDPFPIFSALIQMTYRFGGEWLFSVYPFLLLCVYAGGMIGIFMLLYPKIRESKTLYLLFAGGFIFIHSVLFADLSRELSGVLYRGIANYYLISGVLQPSEFGVFLIVSLWLFLRGNTRSAIFTAALVTAVHPSYLLIAGCLTLAYLLHTWKKSHSVREIFLQGALAGAIMLPVVLYTQKILLQPTSPEIMKHAQDILIHVRIPHHAAPARWLANSLYRIPYIMGALWLIRHTKIFMPLLIIFVVSIMLTAVQMITRNDALALIAPWRLFVLLVPFSTFIFVAQILSMFSETIQKYVPKRVGMGIGALIMIICSVYGGYRQFHQNTILDYAPFKELQTFIHEHASPDDLYMVPPHKKEFFHFRLSMGEPLYVNFQVHPFRDADIVEWYDRLQKADAFYRATPQEQCTMLDELQRSAGITRVIVTEDVLRQPLRCPHAHEVFSNEMYAVYALQP